MFRIMKIWYNAVCDHHKEFISMFVNNPSCTSHYMSKYDQNIEDWLNDHYGCRLRLIHNDLDLDEVYDLNYTEIDYKTYERNNGIKISL